MTTTPRQVGRARSIPRQRQGVSARVEILEAAAGLFSEHGYAATSTRSIALAVGIKQASLYYHFANKEDILAGLLEGTVQPSLSFATRLGRSLSFDPAKEQILGDEEANRLVRREYRDHWGRPKRA